MIAGGLEGRILKWKELLVKRGTAGRGVTQVNAQYSAPTDLMNQLAEHERHELRVVAAGLHRRGRALVGSAAATLWGIWTGPHSNSRGQTSQTIESIYASRLPAEHVVEMAGLRFTTPGRTVYDIARRQTTFSGVLAVDSYLAPGWDGEYEDYGGADLRLEELRALIERPHVRGGARARACLELADRRAESPLESLKRTALATSGSDLIRTIEPQAQIRLDGRIVRADALVNDMIWLEADGRMKYDGAFGRSTAEEIRYERNREKQLHNAGFLVVRVGAREIYRDCEFGDTGISGSYPSRHQRMVLRDGVWLSRGELDSSRRGGRPKSQNMWQPTLANGGVIEKVERALLDLEHRHRRFGFARAI